MPSFPGRPDSGFTLIEVMAALVIAALAIVVLLQAGFTGAAENQAAARYEEGLSRAESRLASIGTLTPIQAETLAGDDGGGYRWSVAVTRLQAAGALTLYAVDVTERFGGRDVTLRTERLAEPP
jgi:general secretion pathway protein I